jgi:helicase
MKVETLEAYNVPSDILDDLADPGRGGAAAGTGAGREGVRPVLETNLIVFSPTSSGKTFIGEMAAVKAARGNTKVFYLVPQKALAAEKFEELHRRYEPGGNQGGRVLA